MPSQPYQQQVFSFIASVTGQKNILAIPVEFVRFTGGFNQAALLTQVIYWTDRTDDPDGWFYKTYQMWLDEIAISKYQTMKAAKKLKSMELIETQVKKEYAAPMLYYRLLQENFIDSFGEYLNSRKISSQVESQETSLTKIKKLNYRKSRNLINLPLYTETITETTTTAPLSLFSFLPEKYNTASIQTLIEKSLIDYSENYIKEAIQYAADHSTGGTITKFKAYLAKTIQGGWAEGYESEKTQERNVDFTNMSLESVKLLASANNVHAQKELERRI